MIPFLASFAALSKDQRAGSEMMRFLILVITLALFCLAAFRRFGR